MKIIRWLLSHSLFILLIVAVIYAYMFWGNLLGKDTPAGKAVAYLSNEFVEVEEFVNAVKARQAQLSEEQSSVQQASKPEMAETANVNDTDKSSQQIKSIEPESKQPEAIATNAVAVENQPEVASIAVEPQPVIEQPVIEQPVIEQQRPESKELESAETEAVAVEAKMEVANNPVEPQPVIEQPMNEQQQPVSISNNPALAASQENTAVNKAQFVADETYQTAAMPVTQSNTEGVFVSADVAKQLANVDEHGEVIDASQPNGAVRENWITARKSFYLRDYELSEQKYQQVIDNTKNNYDAYGELGNVYFNQGKKKQAASAYFEAAAILVNTGQANRARSLMGLLRYLDRSKATELQQLIDLQKS
ncbi:MAG: hypothetical protein GQ573_06030 [Gammaproteobacteria bacterium]|nr:hypothetical protein [Gammaproteobacteria bacterium]